MNRELAYKVQMLPAKIRDSRSMCEAALLKSGWPLKELAHDLDEAMRWAGSHCVVQAQEKQRRMRAVRKSKVRGDDALDMMFSSVGADPAQIPRRKEFTQKGNGNAPSQIGALSGDEIMALGFTYSSGSGDFVPVIQYDARAGRLFRVDRVQENGSYVSNKVDVTSNFKAVFDFENIEVGYIMFSPGIAPDFCVSGLGDPFPNRPTDKHLQGVRFMVKLSKDTAGEGEAVREIAGTSAAFRMGIDELHNAYEAGKAANSGKLPVVVLKTTTPITSGQGQKKSTNYQPVFEIVSWTARPEDFVFVSKATGRKTEEPKTNHASAPSTGSTQVSAPVAKQLEPASADDFG